MVYYFSSANRKEVFLREAKRIIDRKTKAAQKYGLHDPWLESKAYDEAYLKAQPVIRRVEEAKVEYAQDQMDAGPGEGIVSGRPVIQFPSDPSN